MHNLKFKEGDTVRVIGNRFDHCLEIGKTYVILEAVKESRAGGPNTFQEYRLSSSGSGWVAEVDIVDADATSHSTWIDKSDGSSVRGDGAKVGAFWNKGLGEPPEWWGYPANWTPRGNVPATGPWATAAEAKASIDSILPMEQHNVAI